MSALDSNQIIPRTCPPPYEAIEGLQNEQKGVPDEQNRGSDGLRDVWIAVMGVTGAGKSQFIRNAADDEDVGVGDGLQSRMA